MSYSRICETGHYIWSDGENMHFDDVEVNEDILNIWIARLYKRKKELRQRIKAGKILIEKFTKER